MNLSYLAISAGSVNCRWMVVGCGSVAAIAASVPERTALVAGVSHCHKRGVVHMDLKLENVMLCADPASVVRIIDFGLAAVLPLRADGSIEDVHHPLQAYGTPLYRAPEGSPSSAALAPALDVWALGIIAFTLVAGFFPLEEATARDVRFTRLCADQAKGVGACDSVYKMNFGRRRPCPFAPALKAMIDGMLRIDAAVRSPMAEVAAGEWMAAAPAPPRPARMPTDESLDEESVVYRGAAPSEEDEGEEGEDTLGESVPLTRQPAERRAGWN